MASDSNIPQPIPSNPWNEELYTTDEGFKKATARVLGISDTIQFKQPKYWSNPTVQGAVSLIVRERRHIERVATEWRKHIEKCLDASQQADPNSVREVKEGEQNPFFNCETLSCRVQVNPRTQQPNGFAMSVVKCTEETDMVDVLFGARDPHSGDFMNRQVWYRVNKADLHNRSTWRLVFVGIFAPEGESAPAVSMFGDVYRIGYFRRTARTFTLIHGHEVSPRAICTIIDPSIDRTVTITSNGGSRTNYLELRLQKNKEEMLCFEGEGGPGSLVKGKVRYNRAPDSKECTMFDGDFKNNTPYNGWKTWFQNQDVNQLITRIWWAQPSTPQRNLVEVNTEEHWKFYGFCDEVGHKVGEGVQIYDPAIRPVSQNHLQGLSRHTFIRNRFDSLKGVVISYGSWHEDKRHGPFIIYFNEPHSGHWKVRSMQFNKGQIVSRDTPQPLRAKMATQLVRHITDCIKLMKWLQTTSQSVIQQNPNSNTQ